MGYGDGCARMIETDDVEMGDRILMSIDNGMHLTYLMILSEVVEGTSLGRGLSTCGLLRLLQT